MFAKEPVPCTLCGSRHHAPLYRSRPGIVRCADCGFVYANPRITRAAAAELYSRQYFESQSSRQMGYDNYVSDRSLVEKTFHRRLRQVEALGRPEHARLLDVGCATGFFLLVARKRGWEVEGIEISDYCCRYAKEQFGLELFQGPFEDYPPERPAFDLVTMWDYLEHSFVPREDLLKAHAILKAGGWLAIMTPDLSSFPARLFRDRWIGFKEDEHLSYFTKENLVQLVKDSGFEIRRVSHAGKFISAGFFARRAQSYSPAIGRALETLTRASGLGSRSFYCNPFDIVHVLAEKR